MPLKVSFNFDLEATNLDQVHDKDTDVIRFKRRRVKSTSYKENFTCWLVSLGTVLIASAILNPGASTWLDNLSLPLNNSQVASTPSESLRERKSQLNPIANCDLEIANCSVFPLGKGNSKSFPITDVPGSCRDKCARIHAGTDYGYAGNIYNGISGVIIEARASSVGGIVAVKSKHKGENVTLRYVHLNLNSISKWKVGDKVEAGTVLGIVRETFPGSTGPHLHLEVYRNGTLDMKGYRYVARL